MGRANTSAYTQELLDIKNILEFFAKIVGTGF